MDRWMGKEQKRGKELDSHREEYSDGPRGREVVGRRG